MTTAARPTFNPAKGGYTARDRNVPTQSYSSRELPSHTSLKLRQKGQDTAAEINTRNLKAELLLREAEHFEKARQVFKRRREQLLKSGHEDDDDDDVVEIKKEPKAKRIKGVQRTDVDEVEIKSESEDEGTRADKKGKGKARAESPAIKREEGVIDDDDDDVIDSESSSEEDSDEEDDDAALLRELQKIKAERAAASAAAQQAEQEASNSSIMSGNPLLDLGSNAGNGDFNVQRRWDDDVIFKNQARGEKDKDGQKRFVNDLLRSDFHRKFMAKYVQ